jgi:hypothetical protein
MRILAAAAAALGAVALAAGPAGAATPHHHKRQHAKTTTSRTVVRPAATPSPAPAAPAVTSVISIGGYVFYNVSYADAVSAYDAAVAAGAPPQAPVTSVSVTTTVGGTAG